MFKRLWIAVLLTTATLHTGAIAKTKEKDKGTVDVTVTAPADGASYTAPATLVLTADAAGTQQNHPIVQVQFYQGTSLIGTATQAPYAINWSNVAAGNYLITAKAYNDKGDFGISAPVNLNVNAPPSVGIASPANGVSYTGPATITLTANAADSDGTVARVDFYSGAALIGSATAAPYAVTLANVLPGNYTVTAQATDNQGATAVSAPIALNVNAPPTVSLTAPANNTTYASPATITLSANAADRDGNIARVEFYQGNTLIGTATQAPYTVQWSNVPAGTYTVTARATDNQGGTAVSGPLTVKVVVNQLPAAALTVPSDNQTFTAPANVIVQATASDTDGTIARVELYQNGTLITALTDAPYLYYWSNVAAGNYALTAKAIDNLGGATQSAPVRIKVVANQLPTVSVTATPGRATPPASITLSATAADADGTIARVEFFQGSTLLASVTQPPYRYVWTPVGAGSYAITAKATDNQGGVTVSDAAAVEVVADTTQVYYIQADHLNTPRVVTDANNNVVWQWENADPFGNNLPVSNGGVEFNLRFPGQYYDRETGLHYNAMRDYDPSTGRYIQSDPIGLDGGINTYAYVGGNPVSRIDPLGLAGMAVYFGGYQVDTGMGFSLPLGHAGVVAIDNNTGAAQYFDFGRYGGQYGDVRGPYPIGTVTFDKNGMPTQDSMNALNQTMSDRFGKGTYPNSVYNGDADSQKIINFALDRQKNVAKYPYSINPFGKNKFNVCDTFAKDALEAGSK